MGTQGTERGRHATRPIHTLGCHAATSRNKGTHAHTHHTHRWREPGTKGGLQSQGWLKGKCWRVTLAAQCARGLVSASPA